MDQLEDSTLDLIYRRRVRSFHPGYVVMLMIVGAILALPLVKVDVVTTTAGMIRPLEEPVGILSPITGILDSTILRNNVVVNSGDTMAWIRRDHPEARIREYLSLISGNQALISDIRRILEGKEPAESRFIQSYRNHLSALSHLQIRKEFLHGEYKTAAALFRAEVIPLHEYEQAESEFRVLCARINELREHYKNQLEEELYRLEQENREYQKEITLTRSLLKDYFLVAPATGTVHNCPGLTAGSVVQSGMSFGSISPSGNLVAECFLDPGSIQGIGKGTRVRLRFDGSEFQHHAHLEAEVDHVERDVILMEGKPVYRIRCTLDTTCIILKDGKRRPLMKGMTFTASFVLFRRSLSSLVMERINKWANPAGLTDENEKG